MSSDQLVRFNHIALLVAFQDNVLTEIGLHYVSERRTAMQRPCMRLFRMSRRAGRALRNSKMTKSFVKGDERTFPIRSIMGLRHKRAYEAYIASCIDGHLKANARNMLGTPT